MARLDAAGNSTLLSPHDQENFWVFNSHDERSELHIDVEKLLRTLNHFLGTDFVSGDMAYTPFMGSVTTLQSMLGLVQEQQAQIKALEARIEDLESRLRR